MVAKIRKEDFLFTTGRIRSLERGLINRERVDQMLDAKTEEDALRVLYDCGYQEELSAYPELESALSHFRANLYTSLGSFIPVPELLDIFKLKYDFHNIKTAVKSGSVGIFIDAGVFPADKIASAVRDGADTGLPDAVRSAIKTAVDTITTTGDPQLTDFGLDLAQFSIEMEIARKIGSEFLSDYVTLRADIANLRSVVRAVRMGKSSSLLRHALSDLGTVPASSLMGADISDLPVFFKGILADAASLAASGAPMSAVDLSCDAALREYMRGAKYVIYGEEPVSAYLFARENEITLIRIVMAGRAAGLAPDAIHERAGVYYV